MLLERKFLMRGDFTICMVTFLNGVLIGQEMILYRYLELIRKGLDLVNTAYYAEEAIEMRSRTVEQGFTFQTKFMKSVTLLAITWYKMTPSMDSVSF